MGNLAHYTNKKKPIIMKVSDGPRDMSFEEVLQESGGMIEKMVKKYHWCTTFDTMIEDDDIRNNVNFGLFKAYTEYQYDYFKNGTHVWFLKFAEGYIKNSLREFMQHFRAKKRTPVDSMVYYDSFEKIDEDVDEAFIVADDIKIDIIDYIKAELPQKKVDLYIEMCEDVMNYGNLSVKEITQKFNMPRQTVSYQWERLVEHIRSRNSKTHIFF